MSKQCQSNAQSNSNWTLSAWTGSGHWETHCETRNIGATMVQPWCNGIKLKARMKISSARCFRVPASINRSDHFLGKPLLPSIIGLLMYPTIYIIYIYDYICICQCIHRYIHIFKNNIYILLYICIYIIIYIYYYIYIIIYILLYIYIIIYIYYYIYILLYIYIIIYIYTRNE